MELICWLDSSAKSATVVLNWLVPNTTTPASVAPSTATMRLIFQMILRWSSNRIDMFPAFAVEAAWTNLRRIVAWEPNESSLFRTRGNPDGRFDVAAAPGGRLTRAPFSPGRLEPGQHGGQVLAENVGEIAALLHEHRGQAEPRDRAADAPETGRGHRQSLERIVLGRIEAKCDDERAGGEGMDGLGRGLERLQIGVVAALQRQGNVEVGAEPGAGATFMRVAPHKRIVVRRI